MINLDNIPGVDEYLRDISLRIKLRCMDTYFRQSLPRPCSSY